MSNEKNWNVVFQNVLSNLINLLLLSTYSYDVTGFILIKITSIYSLTVTLVTGYCRHRSYDYEAPYYKAVFHFPGIAVPTDLDPFSVSVSPRLCLFTRSRSGPTKVY